MIAFDTAQCTVGFPDLFSPVTQPFKVPPELLDPKPQLWFAIGAARSGKSTYAKRWMRGEVTPEGGFAGPRAVWNGDAMRLAVTGERYNRHAEPFVHMIKTYAVKSLLEYGHSVLIDGTHTTEESIRNVLRIDINARPITFLTDEEECKRRAIATGQNDLLPVIERHWEQIRCLLHYGLPQIVSSLRNQVSRRYSCD